MTAQVLPMKSPSVNALTQQTKAAWDRADKDKKSADDWYVRTGRLLVELKALVKAEGGSWLGVLEKMGRSQQRAHELMQLAGGEVTVDEQRERVRVAVAKSRAKKKSPIRNSDKCDKKVTEPRKVIPFEDDYAPTDTLADRAHNGVSTLFGEIIARTAYLDFHMEGWREIEFPSHIKTLGREAATELASLLKIIGVK